MKAQGRKQGKKANDEMFSPWAGAKQTAHERKTMRSIKPIAPAVMAAALVKAHGKEKALRNIVEPCAISSFRDKHGAPVQLNEHANYWNEVKRALK